MTATLSPCGKYRYTLTRSLGQPGFRACVVMVNPSTADAIDNDATIRKLIGFGRGLQWSEFTVVNLFAYRATDVRKLADADDPIGPANNNHLVTQIALCNILVFAWGASGKLPPRLQDRWRYVAALAVACGKQPYSFGICQDGHPCHPVMLGYNTPLSIWEPPHA